MCGRGWILRDWFDRLANQDAIPAKEMGVVFHVGPSNDDTVEIIDEEDRFAFIECLTDDSDGHVESGRTWNMARYDHMAKMRNELLELARGYSPDFYLSCDTDMLLPSNTLAVLLQEFGQFAGIAPCTFMTPMGTGKGITNGMEGTQRRFVANPVTEPIYACFGTVLMTPELMKVPYEMHGLGEDLGWAKNVHMARLRLAITGKVLVKHVMHPDHLLLVDDRVGF